MVFISLEEKQMVLEFKETVGQERLDSFTQYAFRPLELSDQELFVLFNLQQEAVFVNSQNNPLSKDNLQTIHDNFMQLTIFQMGTLVSALNETQWEQWRKERHQWIHSLYSYNNELSRQIFEEGLSETRADELLLCKYFSELYLIMGGNAFNQSKKILGSEYDADSSFNTWFKDLNRDMTDLHMNAIEVYDKRNGNLNMKTGAELQFEIQTITELTREKRGYHLGHTLVSMESFMVPDLEGKFPLLAYPVTPEQHTVMDFFMAHILMLSQLGGMSINSALEDSLNIFAEMFDEIVADKDRLDLGIKFVEKLSRR